MKNLLFLLIILLIRGDTMEFYKNIKNIKNPENLSVLVNKNNILDKDYIPKDLKKIDTKYAKEDKYLREVAQIHYEKMAKLAHSLGYHIKVVSAYRSYDYQDNLYQYYVKDKGVFYADSCSARPGHSEHQTGLSFDVEGENQDYNRFEETKEFLWMQENAYKFGFILRYPKGKEEITGFKYEPWHYRYVGKKIATLLYKKNLTLEEYKKGL